MTNHSHCSSFGGDILTETPRSNSKHQNSEELLSEIQTECTTGQLASDDEDHSVTRGRTSVTVTTPRSSRHQGEGDHVDRTSNDETSIEISCKHTTEHTSILDGHKCEAVHSRHGGLNHSAAVMTKYSSDFESLSTARTLKSVSSLRYMDDFDSTTSSKTAKSQYTTAYSEDFESGSMETDTAQSRDISDVSQSGTSTRSETRSNVSKDQSERTDMTQNDVNDTDTEYSSDSDQLDQLETQSTSQCSVSYTDSSKRSGSTSKQSSDQQTDASDVTDSKRGTATKCTEESGGTPRAVSHTYSSASEAKYSYDDDFTQHEASEEEEEEDREEREAAHKAELTYIERKLQALKSGPACRSTPVPHLRLQPSKRGIKNTQHLEDFCCRKLALLKKKRHSPALIGSTLNENEVVRHRESARCMYLGLEGSQRVDTHGMSSIKVRKLRERHAMEQIRKAAQTKVHIPRKCPACREKMAELAEEEFFRAKTAKMLARLLEQKYEKHLLKYSDTVGLIGELVHELPTMQQSPSDITRQLLQPLEYRPRVGTEESPSYHLKETNRLQPDVLQDPAEVWEAYMAPLHNSNWMPAKS